jgi:hypothetical protein
VNTRPDRLVKPLQILMDKKDGYNSDSRSHDNPLFFNSLGTTMRVDRLKSLKWENEPPPLGEEFC